MLLEYAFEAFALHPLPPVSAHVPTNVTVVFFQDVEPPLLVHVGAVVSILILLALTGSE